MTILIIPLQQTDDAMVTELPSVVMNVWLRITCSTITTLSIITKMSVPTGQYLGKGNQWNNGREGNYWDNYSGVDIEGDGIGDVKYTIKGLMWDTSIDGHTETVFGQDNHPLMVPFDISSSLDAIET